MNVGKRNKDPKSGLEKLNPSEISLQLTDFDRNG